MNETFLSDKVGTLSGLQFSQPILISNLRELVECIYPSNIFYNTSAEEVDNCFYVNASSNSSAEV